MRRIAFTLMLSPLAAGCVSTAVGVAKAPFQAAGKVVDWTTTSQDEADRNYGRKMRKQEAKEGRARREAAERCRRHREQCDVNRDYNLGATE